jgi:hypothetical protein
MLCRGLLVATVMAASPGHAASSAPCDLGWYVIRNAPSTARGALSARVVSVVGDKVSIDGVCPETTAAMRRGRTRTKVRASWNGCIGVAGPVRLRAAIARGCGSMRGTLKAARTRPRLRRFTAERTLGDTGDCSNDDTFAVLQRRIFGPKGCRVASCHGEFQAGGLDLRAGTAYGSLVGHPATAAAATRVVPGDPEASFLWRKLTGNLGPGEGTRMPAAGAPPLNALEMELVRAWIENGAAATGRDGRNPCLPHAQFVPATPLPPPPGGYQMVFDGPVLQPGEEIEGCVWVRAPNPTDFAVGRWEYSINPGSHHFAVWDHERGPTPPLNEFDPNDLACIKRGAPVDGRTISGSPEAPYFVDDFPPGVGDTIQAGKVLGLNPHYFNEFDVPIQVKGWINMHPVEGPFQHEAETLFSSTAPLDGRTAYSILVDPFALGTLRLRFENLLGRPMRIFHLSSHQHQRGTRVTAWNAAGAKIFENLDWAHPNILSFQDPYTLAAGDHIDFECAWDNGIQREVRRCGDASHDTACTPGDPVPVKFGPTAQDEMCYLVGFYYTE